MTLLLLCLKIFFARISDVTLGTLRTVFTVRGKTLTAGLIAFVEIFIWFMVAKEALNTESNSIFIVISYAGGYACGTILGTFISNTFINSLITVEVITSEATKENINKIRESGYGISVVNTVERYEENETKSILFITINSRNLKELKSLIYSIDSKAFFVVNESKIVQNGFVK